MAVRAPETFSVAVTLSDDGAPPSAFRLFAAGVTATSKGPIVTTPTALSRVMASIPAHHPDGLLPFDFDHGMVLGLTPSSDSRAAGWFRPEVRGEELWASQIQWTPKGAQALRDREFRYFSPTLYRDYESGEIEELINVALTNMPATLNQAPLVANRGESRGESRGTSMTEQEIAALRAERETLVAASAAMTAELTALRTAAAERDQRDARLALSARIDALCASGKLAPALKEWALTQSPESLEAFAAAAPVLPQGKVSPPPVAGAVALSAEEIELCKQMRISPEVFRTKRDALKGAV